MKRRLLLTLIGISIGFSSVSEAQNRRERSKASQVTINAIAYDDFDKNWYDSRHFDNRRGDYFRNVSNQFMIALKSENIRRARILKQDLLEEMRFEIRNTQRLLRQEKRRVANRVDDRRRNRYRTYDGELYSKRRINRSNLIHLERKLTQQESILWNLEDTRLSRRNRSIVFHRRLLSQFARSIYA